MSCYTKEQIEAAVKSKGYVWFEGAKDYDLNIVGVRNSAIDKPKLSPRCLACNIASQVLMNLAFLQGL